MLILFWCCQSFVSNFVISLAKVLLVSFNANFIVAFHYNNHTITPLWHNGSIFCHILPILLEVSNQLEALLFIEISCAYQNDWQAPTVLLTHVPFQNSSFSTPNIYPKDHNPLAFDSNKWWLVLDSNLSATTLGVAHFACHGMRLWMVT